LSTLSPFLRNIKNFTYNHKHFILDNAIQRTFIVGLEAGIFVFGNTQTSTNERLRVCEICWLYSILWKIIWIRHSLQASIASTHRHVHVQIVVLGSFLHYSWLFFFVLQFDYPVNSIAKEIFWAEIYWGRLLFRAEIYRGRLFFRADRSLGAKQEGLTIVHFLNKLIVSCKEAVRFPF
jgi:hypothetical protein